jgi:hypothetical protein
MLPGITNITVVDGSIGFTTNTTGLHVKLGTASNGPINTLQTFSNVNDVKTAFGSGKLVDATCVSFDIASSPVYAMRMAASVVGTVSDITVNLKTGSDGALATTGSAPLDDYQVVVQIVRAGKVGIAPYPTFVYSLDGGNTFSPETAVPGAGTFVIPSSGVTIVFSNGATGFKTDDEFSFYTVGATFNNSDLAAALTALLLDSRQWEFIHVVGPVSATLASTVDTYMNTAQTNRRFVHAITEARDMALLGTLVGGAITFPLTVTAPASFIIVISSDAGNTYTVTKTFSVPTATYATRADLIAAMNVTAFTGGLFSVGAGVVAGTLSISFPADAGRTVLKVDPASTALYGYTSGQLSTSESEQAWISSITADFVNFASVRVAVCAGDAAIYSQATGQYPRRNIGSIVAGRNALIPLSEDFGNVQRGPLPDILNRLPDGRPGLFHDEYVTPSLDASRFTTLRTIPGIQGYYITNGRDMAPNGSDYTYLQYRRVMDRATTLLNAGSTKFINSTVRTNPNGTIYEVDAVKIERNLYAYIFGNMRTDVQDVKVHIDRNNDVYTTLTFNITANIRPFGYAKFITLSIGFSPVEVISV